MKRLIRGIRTTAHYLCWLNWIISTHVLNRFFIQCFRLSELTLREYHAEFRQPKAELWQSEVSFKLSEFNFRLSEVDFRQPEVEFRLFELDSLRVMVNKKTY